MTRYLVIVEFENGKIIDHETMSAVDAMNCYSMASHAVLYRWVKGNNGKDQLDMLDAK